MNKKVRLALLLTIALLLTGYMVSSIPATPVAAAQNDWGILCSGVTAGERGILFDIAGSGVNDESGLFWFINNGNVDENCTLYTTINPALPTNTYPKLRVRAAVNDSARFKVLVFKRNAANQFCDSPVATITWNDTQDHSGFLNREITMPANVSICEVRVKLDDYPNSIYYGMTSALIADIRIWDGATIGWQETFDATP
jgi:hypothetical protein